MTETDTNKWQPQPGDGKRALEEMLAIGARGITLEGLVG